MFLPQLCTLLLLFSSAKGMNNIGVHFFSTYKESGLDNRGKLLTICLMVRSHLFPEGCTMKAVQPTQIELRVIKESQG